jgi:hypothetical protein
MLGWMILVSSQSPEERDASDSETKKAAVLAKWEVGPGGLNWIEDLVRAGKAEKRFGGGYPSRYIAKASDILSILAEGLPAHTGPTVIGYDYVLPENWQGKVNSNPAGMIACSADHLLTIDAWDLS